MKKRFACLAMCVATLMTLCLPLSFAEEEGEAVPAASVWFLRAGKADSILVSAGGTNWLIDTGKADSVPEILASLRSAGIVSFDGVFLTHTHSDHIGGLTGVLTHVPVKKVYRAAISEKKKKGGSKIDEAAEECGMTVAPLFAGGRVRAGEQAAFTVLGPLVYNGEDDNDNSLVLSFETAGRRVLLCGDMQFAEERTLMDAGTDLRADILKVGNHGNGDACSDELVAAVSPSVAVFTTDLAVKPDSACTRIREALEEAGSEWYITGETAMGVRVDILSDGRLRTVLPERPAPAEQSLRLAADTEEQLLSVENEGALSADLSGCMLLGEKKGELFVFEEGTALGPGESVTVSGSKGDGELIMNGVKKLFGKKDGSVYALYDRNANLIAVVD